MGVSGRKWELAEGNGVRRRKFKLVKGNRLSEGNRN